MALYARLFILLIFAPALVGCPGRSTTWLFGNNPHASEDAPTDRPIDSSGVLPGSSSINDPNTPKTILQLRFELLRVEIPAATGRHAKKVWNHVDELRLDPGLSSVLARNGLRIGAAPKGAWPALKAVFDAASARIGQQQFVLQGGVPLIAEFGTMRDTRTIFMHDRAGGLSGRSIPPGDRRIILNYLLHPELSGAIDISTIMEIRHDRGTMEWRNEGGVIRQVPAYDHYRFNDLSTALALRPGEMLVMGLSDEAIDNDYLIGSIFFRDSRSGEPVETVLCITPRPYAVEVRGQTP